MPVQLPPTLGRELEYRIRDLYGLPPCQLPDDLHTGCFPGRQVPVRTDVPSKTPAVISGHLARSEAGGPGNAFFLGREFEEKHIIAQKPASVPHLVAAGEKGSIFSAAGAALHLAVGKGRGGDLLTEELLDSLEVFLPQPSQGGSAPGLHHAQEFSCVGGVRRHFGSGTHKV